MNTGYPLRLISDVPVTSKSVILRLDLNVPISSEDFSILDDSRILASLDTIKYLFASGAKIIIISHLGRPSGIDIAFSLKTIAKHLQSLLGIEVHFFDSISEKSLQRVTQLPYPCIAMLENLRFYDGEEECDENFSRLLSFYGNIYVNDAFACSHRSHASITGIANYIPAFAGFGLIKEMQNLEKLYSAKSLCTIIGGGKVSTKIEVLKALVQKSKNLIVAGGMANTFLVARGKHIGSSFNEKEYVNVAKEILVEAKNHNCNIYLPQDYIVINSADLRADAKIASSDSITSLDSIVDIGPNSIGDIMKILELSDFVMWNGPLGIYEEYPFDCSSIMLARIIASLTEAQKIFSFIGGGDSIACINKARLTTRFSFVSTGGGALLEYIANSNLPGIDAISGKINL